MRKITESVRLLFVMVILRGRIRADDLLPSDKLEKTFHLQFNDARSHYRADERIGHFLMLNACRAHAECSHTCECKLTNLFCFV